MEKYFGWQILLEIKESHATVVKRRGEKIFLSNNIIYSKLRDDSIYTRSYWDYFLPLPSIYDNPKVLIIGLGGGTIPFQMQKIFGKNIDIDVVELDPNMLKVVDVFLPEKLNANVTIDDGYKFVQRVRNKYDVIIMDPFINAEIPKSFFEQKFIENASKALKSNGILAINYIFSASGMARQYEFKRKLRKFFNVYVLSYSALSSNRIILCSKSMKSKAIFSKLSSNFPIDRENSFLLKPYRKMG
jgi:spermidine synthase